MDIKQMVVATDFSEPSLVAIETAWNLALDSDAIVYLLHVIERPMGLDPMVGLIKPPVGAEQKEALRRLAELIPDNLSDKARIEMVIRVGVPEKVIAELAREKDVDLIVVGTHGRTGLSRALMGSTAENLLRKAPCQVLVVKQHQATPAPEQESEEAPIPSQ